jgi:hypothetical protein
MAKFKRIVLQLAPGALMLCGAVSASAEQSDSSAPTQQLLNELLRRVEADEARIHQLEQKLAVQNGGDAAKAVPAVLLQPAAAVATAPAVAAQPAVALLPAESPATSAAAPAAVPLNSADPQAQDMSAPGHSMEIAGGPVLNIKGFFDFNFGVGSIANPLVFPIVDSGCGTCGNSPTPAHTAFQAGEFDLFISSKLSDHLSFVSEVVLGPSNNNVFGLDIERYQLTYKANPYFSVSAGRFHTSLGYYNTAYHHGNWFSTAEGRPIMYLFEDSGGILPMHMVGLSFAGAVPHTEALGLHWIAEIGNGNSSNPAIGPSGNDVQNFYSDRNYKATNLAAYIKPQFLSGLQIGGSWYHDGLNPSQAQSPLPLPEVRQNIESAYVVYFSQNWEFMNEAVLLTNHLTGTAESFRSPMAYTQIAHKFGIYKPYFRYQYVNDNMKDPLNLLTGTYYGPSIGVRVDFWDFAAFKLQYNHLFQSNQLPGNGLNGQIAFTF